MVAKKAPTDKAKNNSIVSLNFDLRFLQFAELCIAGAIAEDDFGDIFETVETVADIESLEPLPVSSLKLAAILDTLIRRVGSNDPALHQAVLQTMTEMLQQSEGRTDSLSFSRQDKKN